jgi:hypothetical protein
MESSGSYIPPSLRLSGGHGSNVGERKVGFNEFQDERVSTPERIETWRDRSGAVTCKIAGVVEVRVEPVGSITIRRPGHEDLRIQCEDDDAQ